ncbi:MAG: winged helix-turn-helix domain-containing protein, partial [Arcobacteraceae bacterium]
DELEVKIEKLCQLENALISLSDGFNYDIEKRELYNNEQIKLTKKETLLLHQLITNKNKVISYDNILNYVWEGDVATTDSIRTLVMRLRKKIPKDSLETIVDFGYKFHVN